MPSRGKEGGRVMPMTFGFYLQANAKKFAERTAIICEDTVLTYMDLHIRSNQLANAFLQRGIRKGDKVAAYLTNCIEYVETMFALAKIGAVLVPISYRLVPRELKYVVENSDSVALIFNESLAGNVLAIRDELKGVILDRLIQVGSSKDEKMLFYEEFLQSGKPEDPGVEVTEEDVFYLGYTAGTTGFPKGAVLTHKARMLTLLQIAIEYGFGSEDKTLNCGPLYHAAPMAFTLVHLLLGGQVILMKEFDPEKVLKNIQDFRVTNSFMVPTMYNMVINLPIEVRRGYDVSSVRGLVSGGASLLTKVKEGILEFFSNAGLHEFYGSTEIAIATNLRPEDQLRKIRCVGLPTYFVDLKILDSRGNEVPRGETGLIYVKTPYALKEYYKNPKSTQAAFLEDWFTNDDVGRLDEEGYLYIVDRKADMVISGGANIYPTETEEVLHQHPNILEASVIGIPDEKWGEALLAFIIPKPGKEINHQEITSFCEGKLAKYKIPRHIKMVKELPKSPAGKVLKRILREPFWKDQETNV